MALTADDIIKIMEKAKELGLIDSSPKPEPKQEVDLEKIYIGPAALDEPDEEMIKYWATPYYDVLMAEREAKKQKLNEEKEIRNG